MLQNEVVMIILHQIENITKETKLFFKKEPSRNSEVDSTIF